MSDPDPTKPLIDLDQIEAEEQREKFRNYALIAIIAVIGCAVAFWVGTLINANQDQTTKAEQLTEQAQVEKFNLAQQVAAACADPSATALDEATYERLCTDARTIVKAGPRGAQGIPGPQGIQGLPGAQGVPGTDGLDGADGAAGKDGAQGPEGPAGPPGADGATGPQGPPGKDGADGATGPAGEDGQDGAAGQPPFSWVVYDQNGNEIRRCERTAEFDPAAPTYTCTETRGGPLP